MSIDQRPQACSQPLRTVVDTQLNSPITNVSYDMALRIKDEKVKVTWNLEDPYFWMGKKPRCRYHAEEITHRAIEFRYGRPGGTCRFTLSPLHVTG